jgi:hypothetical protein
MAFGGLHASAEPASTIQWKVANPFPFIKDDEIVSQIKDVYDHLARSGEPSSLALERALQNNTQDRFGWFSRIAQNDSAATCWDSKNIKFRSEDPLCTDYFTAKSHKIRIWVSNKESLQGRECAWFADDIPIAKQNCDEEIIYSLPYGETRILTVQISGLLNSDPPAEKVFVDDKLVVGLGDSYASGEGNPDSPATIDLAHGNPDSKLFSSTGLPTPTHLAGSRAEWLDRRCHRSMYSYQFKTALQLALSKPNIVVRFISFACSGAVTNDIFKKPQTSLQEHAPKSIDALRPDKSYRRVEIQINALKKLLYPLGKPSVGSRPIDYLLISTGGNDVHFARYVAYIALAGNSWLNVPLRLVGQKKTPPRRPKEITQRLARNYDVLNRILLNDLDIRGCEFGKICNRIILTAYPSPLTDESENLCTGERGEFKVPFGEEKEPGRENRIRRVAERVIEPLSIAQRDASQLYGWTLVTEHLGQFRQHGFCGRDLQNIESPNEILSIPVLRNGQWFYRSKQSEQWLPFDIDQYLPYATRQRWFRLPVDAKLVIAQGLNRYGIKRDLFFSDELAGIMHPTAEGAAAMADANLSAIEGIDRSFFTAVRFDH